jgi:transposase
MQASTIGIDLAKSVFQVHGVDATGKVAISRQLRRGQLIDFFRKLPPCLIGMEACATAHHWARELTKLGHTVRLMPASYVKAYVKRSKNDAADAAAICEAVTRPNTRPSHNRLNRPVTSAQLLLEGRSDGLRKQSLVF